MIKLVTRIGSIAMAAFSIYCFTCPQTPHRLLADFVEAREASAKIAGRTGPTRDVLLAKAALAMFDARIAKAGDLDATPSSSKPDFDSAFFEIEPTSPSDRQPLIAIPFFGNDTDSEFQPIDTGATIQANPFLD